MKHVTLIVWIAFAILLSVQNRPIDIYNEVKADVEAKGRKIPWQWHESVELTSLRPKLYGISLDMGAHANSVNILINRNEWNKMTKKEKKMLLLHEGMHSWFETRHCFALWHCVMSSGSIKIWGKMDYDKILTQTLDHHTERPFIKL